MSFNSKMHYEKRAKEGYGLMYPDGHVIRGWENLLKNHILNTGNMLDFGCWNGTHASYFSSKGFVVHGVDIVESAVNAAKSLVSDCSHNFYTITDDANLDAIFGCQFDLILANQVLYFLDDPTLLKRLDEFDRLLSVGGYVFFTMMSRRNYFSKYSAGVMQNGLERVVFPKEHRFYGKEPHVRFVESFDQLKAVFCKFECTVVGLYDVIFNEVDSAEHYIFIGKKRVKE